MNINIEKNKNTITDQQRITELLDKSILLFFAIFGISWGVVKGFEILNWEVAIAMLAGCGALVYYHFKIYYAHWWRVTRGT